MPRIVYDNPVDPSAPNSAHAMALDFIGSNKRVLEFGCSTGQVTRVLRSRGCEVVGVELDPEAARIAAEFATEVLVCDLDADDVAAKLEERTFEVVLFGDVLEHLRDPLRALKLARSVLEPGGSIVISLPNVAHVDLRLALLQGRFRYTESGLLDRTHVSLFTKVTAEELLSEAGLVALEVRRVIMPAFMTEVGVDRATVASELLTEVLRDPEAEVYQYVFRAIPDTGDVYVRDVVARSREHEERLRELEIEHELALVELRSASHELAVARVDLEALTAELHALHNTKLHRYSRLPRRVYGRVARAVSGE